MAPKAVDTVLVPVDGSDESTDAAEYAAAIAATYDASVHAMYVLGDEATRAIERGAVDPDDVADETRAYVDAVEEIAGDAGVPITHSIAYGFSTRRKLVHPGSVVLDAADEIDADFLVLPRGPDVGGPDGVAADADAVLQKAAGYVVAYASQPVLSV